MILIVSHILVSLLNTSYKQTTFVRITPLKMEYSVNNSTNTPLNKCEKPIGVFFIGQNVSVSGTGGDNLRIRIDGGLDEKILFLVEEHTIMKIADGPKLKDGMIWWKVDTNKGTGWTVQNYLEIKQ